MTAIAEWPDFPDLETLRNESAAVVVGRIREIVDVRQAPDPPETPEAKRGAGAMETRYSVEVVRPVCADKVEPGSTIVLAETGGTVDGLRLEVSGGFTPVLRGSYLMFLRRSDTDAHTYSSKGGSQAAT